MSKSSAKRVRVITDFGHDEDFVKLRVGEVYEYRGFNVGGGKVKRFLVLVGATVMPFPASHFTEPLDEDQLQMMNNPVYGRF